jgi:hypothetical protein
MTRPARLGSDSTVPTPPPSDSPSETAPARSSAPPTGSADTASNSTDSAPTGASATPEPAPDLGSRNQWPTGSSASSSSASAPAPNPDTTAAVQTALGTEYSAVWTYTLITAFLSADLQATAQQDADAHRARRDATIRLLTDFGVPPEPAEPAYRTPVPVTDPSSAVRLALSAETDASAAWCSVLERCDDSGLRHVALDGLTDSAVRGARWSNRLASKPVVPQFPGRSTAT